MSEIFLSSLQIVKLGHKLEEIRIRALNHIISKLDHIVVSDLEFSRYLELIKKLFEWFDFLPHIEEEKALNLLSRILKCENNHQIIKHIGPFALTKDLNDLRAKIKNKYHHIIDDLIKVINSNQEQNKNNELKLISDVPLSYRSDQSEYNNLSYFSHNSKYSTSSNRSYDIPKNCSKICLDKNIGSTATPISGYEQKSSSLSGVQTCPASPNTNTNTDTNTSNLIPLGEALYQSVPYITLNWQPLVRSDSHVLKSVEDSLKRPPEPQVLIHSCEFFCNVILQDFPAEVFLQRPNILALFYEMILNSPSTRITNASLNCLHKLSENLITRIRYYSDPCTFNSKQKISPKPDTEIETPSYAKTFTYNIDVSHVMADDLESDESNFYQQITLPQFCLRTFITVLSYISQKPQSFRDSSYRKKTQSGINLSLQLIDKLTTLITLCIRPCIWSSHVDTTLIEISKYLLQLLDKLGEVLEQYRLMVVATDMEFFERMAQLHLLHSTSFLISELIPITKANGIIPRSLKASLSSCLLDSSFSRLYPNAHENLVQYVNEFKGPSETDSLAKYNDVKIVCKAMSKAVKVLKNTDCYTIDNLRVIRDSIPCLEFHKNLNIINMFLKTCVKNNAMFNLDDISNKLIEGINSTGCISQAYTGRASDTFIK